MGKKKRKGKYSKASARGYATTAVKSKTSQAQIDAFKSQKDTKTPASQWLGSAAAAGQENASGTTDRASAKRGNNSSSRETYNDAPIELKLDQSRQLLEQRPTVLSIDPQVENMVFNKLQPYIEAWIEQLGKATQRKMTRLVKNSVNRAANGLRRAYVTMEGLGVDADLIERALAVAGSDIFKCLDYLCLNAPRESLPVGWYTEELTSSSADQALKFVARQPKVVKDNASEPVVEHHELEQFVNKREEGETKKEMEKSTKGAGMGGAVKDWILNRAEALAEEEEDELNDTPKQRQERLLKQILETRQQAAREMNKGARKVIGRKIGVLTTTLRNLERDYGLTAAELEKSVSVAANEAYGRETEESALHEREKTSAVDLEQGEAIESGFAGLFDAEDDEEGAGASSTSPGPVLTVVEFDMPQSWSGASPVELLCEYCSKTYKQAPAFIRCRDTSGAYVRFTVRVGKDLEIPMPPGEVCVSKTAAQAYASLHALYTINQSSGSRIRLAPVYQDIWLQWKLRDEDAEAAALEERRKPRENCIQRLLETWSQPSSSTENNEAAHMKENTASQKKSYSHVQRGTAEQNREASFLASRRNDFSPPEVQEARGSLPMLEFRREILDTLRKVSILVVCGETGCGKSSQLPQYLVEDALEQDDQWGKTRVVCTEPRRISAVSLAERVSVEMGDPKGCGGRESLVGYQIRGKKKFDEIHGKLLYCTTGILLKQLESDSSLSRYSHVVVDEVHERSVQSDFLLVHLKRLCSSTAGSHLKIILMSATVDAEKFSNYFGGLSVCPVITVPGRTFPVACFHLEDCLELASYVVEKDSEFSKRSDNAQSFNVRMQRKHGAEVSWDDEELQEELWEGHRNVYSKETVLSMTRVIETRINLDLIQTVLGLVLNPKHALVRQSLHEDLRHEFEVAMSSVKSNAFGAVLIFLPGISQIEKLRELLEGSSVYSDTRKYKIFVLHSALTSTEKQAELFRPLKKGCRKIVISTNMAETGVTIPDVTFVIDSCRVNEIGYDPRRGMKSLDEKFVSQASARQRQGRAGRVCPGVCFRLVSRNQFDAFDQYTTPEISRVPLDELSLDIMVNFNESPAKYLKQALDPPDEPAITKAINNLKDTGAVKSVEEEEAEQAIECLDEQLEVTALGRHLARLPLDLKIGKLLILGYVFKCLDPLLTVAASIGEKSVFLRDKAEHHVQYNCGFSDLLPIHVCFKAWESAESKAGYARANYLNQKHLVKLRATRSDLKKQLQYIGFRISSDSREHSPRLLNAIIYAALGTLARADILGGRKQPDRIAAQPMSRISADPVQDIQYMTSQGRAYLFPGSRCFGRGNGVLSKDRKGSVQWMTFVEKMKTSRIYIMNVSFIHPLAVALFCKRSKIHHTDKRLIVDDWISMQVPPRTASVVQLLRQVLEGHLAKIYTAQATNENPVIDAVIELLS